MRLATLTVSGGTRAAVITDDGAVTIDAYADVGELLRAGDVGWEAASQASGRTPQPYDRAQLLRPVLAPTAVSCVGLNYRTHILEMGNELPSQPTLFSKFPRALTDPHADVELPRHSDKVDYEGELALVIARGGRDIDPRDALGHVAGLAVLNDVSARDFQRRSSQFLAGKTFQRSTPWGPWITTLDEAGELGALELVTTVSGEERQRAPISDLVFDVPTLVADLSRIVELEPGDLIATGTPGGVGAPQERFLHDGDVVEVTISGLGTITNTFRTAA